MKACEKKPDCLAPAFMLPIIEYMEPFDADTTSYFATQLQGFAACLKQGTDTAENVVVIGFRGTVTSMNWIKNLDISTITPKRIFKMVQKNQSELGNVTYHHGVYSEYVKLMRHLHEGGQGSNAVHNAMHVCSNSGFTPFHVRIIGHSKGGGIAQIYLHGAMAPDVLKEEYENTTWEEDTLDK